MATQPTAYGDQYALRGYADPYETHLLSGNGAGVGSGVGTLNRNTVASGDGVGSGLGVGVLNRVKRFSGPAVGSGVGTGRLNRVKHFSQEAVGSGSGVAFLNRVGAYSASSEGSGFGVGRLNRVKLLSQSAFGSGSGVGTLNPILRLRSSLERYTDTYGMDYSNVYSGTYTENDVVGAGTGDAAITMLINLRGVRHPAGYSRDPYGGAYADGTQVIFGSEGIGTSDTYMSRNAVVAADGLGEGLSDVHLSRVMFVEGSALGVGEAPSELRRVKLLDGNALGDGTGEGFFIHVTEIEETSCGVLFKDSEVQGILVYTTESEAPLIIEQCSFVETN